MNLQVPRGQKLNLLLFKAIARDVCIIYQLNVRAISEYGTRGINWSAQRNTAGILTHN